MSRSDCTLTLCALCLQEGENNDKFDTHPGSQGALPAYLITHNAAFYSLDFIASVTILALAVFEEPHVPNLYMHLAVRTPYLYIYKTIHTEVGCLV